MSQDNPFPFVSERILCELYENYSDWPAPERLLGRVRTLSEVLDDSDLALASRFLPWVKRSVERCTRLGIVNDAQAKYLREALESEEIRFGNAVVATLTLNEK